MSKFSSIDSIEVIVEIPADQHWRTLTEKQMLSEAEDIVTAIKRHVAPYHSFAANAFVRFDDSGKCEHCGSKWTEKSPIYNGGCCDADQAVADAIEAVLQGARQPALEASP